jgi:phenylalanyl-tRNA synthetase alpha chain
VSQASAGAPPPRVNNSATGFGKSESPASIVCASFDSHLHSTKMAGQRGPVPVYAQASGRDLTQEVLDLLNTKQSVATESDLADVGQAEIKAALDRLASRNMVVYGTNDQEQVILTKEGEQIANEGSHEFKVWDAVKRRGQMPLKELQV